MYKRQPLWNGEGAAFDEVEDALFLGVHSLELDADVILAVYLRVVDIETFFGVNRQAAVTVLFVFITVECEILSLIHI